MAMGSAATWAVTRVMNGLLYGVGSTDPTTFTAVIALLGAVALMACSIPAARASRVDPMTVLRDQSDRGVGPPVSRPVFVTVRRSIRRDFSSALEPFCACT
jgi:hypothetical protein